MLCVFLGICPFIQVQGFGPKHCPQPRWESQGRRGKLIQEPREWLLGWVVSYYLWQALLWNKGLKGTNMPTMSIHILYYFFLFWCHDQILTSSNLEARSLRVESIMAGGTAGAWDGQNECWSSARVLIFIQSESPHTFKAGRVTCDKSLWKCPHWMCQGICLLDSKSPQVKSQNEPLLGILR